MKIAVFVSGRGSNLKAILDSPDLRSLIEVVSVVSNKASCQAFEIANSYNIKKCVIGSSYGCESYGELSDILIDLGVELIVLAGFLKLIPAEFINKFENRIINIHPALLPSFGGKGMYGINVHEAVFRSSAKVSGATVHFVDNKYDSGTIIAQHCVDISDVSSPGDIAAKVLEVEHQLLPEVLKAFANGKVQRLNNRVIIK